MGAIASWGKVFEKLSTFIPGRVEKLKNEKERLLKEKAELLKETHTDEKGRRLVSVNSRLDDIDKLLSNKATD